ncbi:MAG TPA: hypothetical protein VGQ00_03940 [Candidatus Norongarragalinales archaeon]|jgi:hypothetical protein|nr:hypothetical protein [Candidatus Norongarragalinales archaeon]
MSKSSRNILEKHKPLIILIVIVLALGALAVFTEAISFEDDSKTVRKTAVMRYEERTIYDWDITKTVSYSSQPFPLDVPQGQSGILNYNIQATRRIVSTSTVSAVEEQFCFRNHRKEPITLISAETTVRTREREDDIDSDEDRRKNRVIATRTQVFAGETVQPKETRCFSDSIDVSVTPGQKLTATVKVNYEDSRGTVRQAKDSVNIAVPKRPTTVTTDASARVTDHQICPSGATCTPSASILHWDAANNVGEATVSGTTTITFTETVKNNDACGIQNKPNIIHIVETDTAQENEESESASINFGPCP